MRRCYTEIAHEFDKTWQKLKLIIDSMLLIFLIFRILFSKNSYGYGTTISDFWNNCRKMNFLLAHKKPISALAFIQFLLKLDNTIFKVLNNLSENNDNDTMFAAIKVNFKNCLATASKHSEEIMFVPANSVKDVIEQIVDSISRYPQKIRRNWLYLRKSMEPRKKWRTS